MDGREPTEAHSGAGEGGGKDARACKVEQRADDVAEDEVAAQVQQQRRAPDLRKCLQRPARHAACGERVGGAGQRRGWRGVCCVLGVASWRVCMHVGT